MRAHGDFDDPEAAAAHAQRQIQAQAQVAMSDLGTAATRNSDAYMAQTDYRGRVIPSNAFQDAQTAAQVQNRRAQLQASANSATAAWNNPDSIPGSNTQDLGDLFGGQGHRQHFTHAAASVRPGPAAIPRARNGPRPAGIPPSGPAAASASSSTRQRAGSPTAHGTIRDVGGQRQAVPMPIRPREPARDGSFVGPVPGAPRIPARQPVLPAPEIPQIPGAPRLAPVQPVLQVPQTLLPTPTQPFSQVPLASDLPAPLRINRAPQQPATRGVSRQPPQQSARELSAAELDQHKVDKISDAIGTDRLIILMATVYQDGPEITLTKVHVRVCAVHSSEPNSAVENKGPQWVAIFYALRKDLISHAIEIAYMADEDQQKQLEFTSDEYFEFGDLFKDVVEARTVVESSAQSNQVIQDKWASDGKKDILDRVIEKVAAITAQVDLETSIQQSSERFNPQMPTAQQYGLSTTITGVATPVCKTVLRKTVHFNPSAESESVVISDGDEHWAVSRKELDLDQLPPGVVTGLSLDFELAQQLSSDDLLGAYVAALKACAGSLDYTPKSESFDEEL